jgi:hypothetical protein
MWRENVSDQTKADLLKTIRAIELRVDGLNTRGRPQKKETQMALDDIKARCRAALTFAQGLPVQREP